MSDIQEWLDKGRALADQATQGPWEAVGREVAQHWSLMADVTPLYPKEQDEWCRAEHCTWRHWRSGSVPTHKRGADCPREEKGQDA